VLDPTIGIRAWFGSDVHVPVSKVFQARVPSKRVWLKMNARTKRGTRVLLLEGEGTNVVEETHL